MVTDVCLWVFFVSNNLGFLGDEPRCTWIFLDKLYLFIMSAKVHLRTPRMFCGDYNSNLIIGPFTFPYKENPKVGLVLKQYNKWVLVLKVWVYVKCTNRALHRSLFTDVRVGIHSSSGHLGQ